jgi:hypothetical protein
MSHLGLLTCQRPVALGYLAPAIWPSPAFPDGDHKQKRTPDKKMAMPEGTAKFREETSKKADSATRSRIAAMHKLVAAVSWCKLRICALQHRIGWTDLEFTHSSRPRAEFSEESLHPAIKSGVLRFSAGRHAPSVSDVLPSPRPARPIRRPTQQASVPPHPGSSSARNVACAPPACAVR